jgi:hypothetical protein
MFDGFSVQFDRPIGAFPPHGRDAKRAAATVP